MNLAETEDPSIKKAWAIFAENPYRILGVSVTASEEEANVSLDKIKKLVRLNAASSFKSEYHLNGTNKPERDISIIQNALTIMKEIRYKWFWFADPEACVAWQNEKYRKELVYDGLEYGTYDLFLANYIYALVFDPSFRKSTLWKPIFQFYAYICSDFSYEILKSRFNEKQKISQIEVMRSFKAEIFKPLETLCKTEDVKQIVRLYKILKEQPSTTLSDLTKKIASKLTKWFTSREEKVCKLVYESDEDRVITASEAREIKKVGDIYVREVDKVVDSVLDVVRDEPVRHEMIKESYRHATWQLMFALNKAGEKEKAISYANKCYPYCDDKDKRKIRNTFGLKAIKGAEKDITDAEWDILGDNYYEGKNGYSQDYYEAFRCYKIAAEAGNMYSQNSLGICYQEGNGTYQSDYEAAKWFEKAYQNGNPDGAFNLSRCYALGKGRSSDKHKALELCVEAAKMGHPAAAEMGKTLIKIIEEERLNKLSQHENYDLGYQMVGGRIVIVEVTLNYSANVYLMDRDNYYNYKSRERFSYYGGRATQSPYKIKIPHDGFWNLVIDNGEDGMEGIISSVRTRTINL